MALATPLAALQHAKAQQDLTDPPKVVEFHVSWRNPLHLEGLQADVLKLTVGGGGSANLRGLQVGKIVLRAGGGSRVELEGYAERSELRVSGGSRLEAYGLQSPSIRARLSGGSRGKVLATGELQAQVSGAATLTYRGTPSKLTKHVSGSASLQRALAAPTRSPAQQRRLDSLQRKLQMRMTVEIQGQVS